MSPSDTHRLSDLLGATVVTTAGTTLGHVNDVRLTAGGKGSRPLRGMVTAGIIVSDRHAGSMLGYDRHDAHGPWLVRAVVRALHRNACYIPWTAIHDIDWDGHAVTVASHASEPLRPL